MQILIDRKLKAKRNSELFYCFILPLGSISIRGAVRQRWLEYKCSRVQRTVRGVYRLIKGKQRNGANKLEEIICQNMLL